MGFPHLAHLIAQDPDGELYVFRSFSELGARTLLHLQSEIALLEKEQKRLDEEAANFDADRHVQMMLTRWEGLERLDDEARHNTDVQKRIELADLIATKLERYCKLTDHRHC